MFPCLRPEFQSFIFPVPLQDLTFHEHVLDLANLVLVCMAGPEAQQSMASAVDPERDQVQASLLLDSNTADDGMCNQSCTAHPLVCCQVCCNGRPGSSAMQSCDISCIQAFAQHKTC